MKVKAGYIPTTTVTAASIVFSGRGSAESRLESRASDIPTQIWTTIHTYQLQRGMVMAHSLGIGLGMRPGWKLRLKLGMRPGKSWEWDQCERWEQRKGDLPLTALRIVSLTVTLRSEVVTMERCWAFTSDETTEKKHQTMLPTIQEDKFLQKANTAHYTIIVCIQI